MTWVGFVSVAVGVVALLGSGGCSDNDGGSQSSCPAPDPGLSAVPEGQAASTQAAYGCMAVVACLCDERSHETVPSCRHSENMRYEWIQDEARALGLVYDGGCLAQHVADLEDVGCDEMPAMDDWSVIGRGRCSVFHGTRRLDESCVTISGGLSDCAQGLACWNDRCVDPCTTEDAGARCGDLFNFSCAPGHACVLGACVERPSERAIGESCEDADCVASATCRQLCPGEDCTYTCIERRADGVLCATDDQCLSDFCSEGQCAAGPVTGEPCLAERCLAGRECIDGVCGAPEGAICTVLG